MSDHDRDPFHQVAEFNLPPQAGKTTDSRAAAFVAANGRLVQVEVDALEPSDLHQLFDAALARWWNPEAYEAEPSKPKPATAITSAGSSAGPAASRHR